MHVTLLEYILIAQIVCLFPGQTCYHFPLVKPLENVQHFIQRSTSNVLTSYIRKGKYRPATPTPAAAAAPSRSGDPP